MQNYVMACMLMVITLNFDLGEGGDRKGRGFLIVGVGLI